MYSIWEITRWRGMNRGSANKVSLGTFLSYFAALGLASNTMTRESRHWQERNRFFTVTERFSTPARGVDRLCL